MNAKNPVFGISLFVIALFAGPSVTRAQSEAEPDIVTAIFNLENDAVRADLAGDAAFYKKVLAEDWTRGDSDGTFYTKFDLLKLMADTKNLKTNSEKLSELKVRVYGNVAVATYKDTYDILIMGKRRAHTIIATDTFVKSGGEWKEEPTLSCRSAAQIGSLRRLKNQFAVRTLRKSNHLDIFRSLEDQMS